MRHAKLMEPLFKILRTRAVNNVDIASIPQYLRSASTGAPQRSRHHNPDYRRWWQSLIETSAAAMPSTASCGATGGAARWIR